MDAPRVSEALDVADELLDLDARLDLDLRARLDDRGAVLAREEVLDDAKDLKDALLVLAREDGVEDGRRAGLEHERREPAVEVSEAGEDRGLDGDRVWKVVDPDEIVEEVLADRAFGDRVELPLRVVYGWTSQSLLRTRKGRSIAY